jgi:hypothetical protein
MRNPLRDLLIIAACVLCGCSQRNDKVTASPYALKNIWQSSRDWAAQAGIPTQLPPGESQAVNFTEAVGPLCKNTFGVIVMVNRRVVYSTFRPLLPEKKDTPTSCIQSLWKNGFLWKGKSNFLETEQVLLINPEALDAATARTVRTAVERHLPTLHWRGMLGGAPTPLTPKERRDALELLQKAAP